MTPFFSIIIPVYNVAPYLRECLDSVLAQTFTDWEAICVDDGSTDGSGAILDEYASNDMRFRVIHQTNAGVGAARNNGLDIANGNWILFLDSDDAWQQNLLSTVVSMVKLYPGEKLFRFGYERFEDEFNVNQINPKNIDCTVIDISKEISMHDFFDYYFCCFVYRRDLFDGIRFPRYIRGEDRWVLNKIQLGRVNAIVGTDCRLYGYRNRAGSAMNSAPSRQVLCDEMDHRLDIMEMIDAGHKKVEYAGNWWLEKYFTRQFYCVIHSRMKDKAEVTSDWRKRLRRLCRTMGLSKYGKFVAWSCASLHSRTWDLLVCQIFPWLREGVSQIKRKLNYV